MLHILREFATYTDTGEEVVLCECQVDTDTTHGPERHSDHYFRTKDGEMRALKATPIAPGVYRLDDGRFVSER